jgi:hypothetical protein
VRSRWKVSELHFHFYDAYLTINREAEPRRGCSRLRGVHVKVLIQFLVESQPRSLLRLLSSRPLSHSLSLSLSLSIYLAHPLPPRPPSSSPAPPARAPPGTSFPHRPSSPTAPVLLLLALPPPAVPRLFFFPQTAAFYIKTATEGEFSHPLDSAADRILPRAAGGGRVSEASVPSVNARNEACTTSIGGKFTEGRPVVSNAVAASAAATAASGSFEGTRPRMALTQRRRCHRQVKEASHVVPLRNGSPRDLYRRAGPRNFPSEPTLPT